MAAANISTSRVPRSKEFGNAAREGFAGLQDSFREERHAEAAEERQTPLALRLISVSWLISAKNGVKKSLWRTVRDGLEPRERSEKPKSSTEGDSTVAKKVLVYSGAG